VPHASSSSRPPRALRRRLVPGGPDATPAPAAPDPRGRPRIPRRAGASSSAAASTLCPGRRPAPTSLVPGRPAAPAPPRLRRPCARAAPRRARSALPPLLIPVDVPAAPCNSAVPLKQYCCTQLSVSEQSKQTIDPCLIIHSPQLSLFTVSFYGKLSIRHS